LTRVQAKRRMRRKVERVCTALSRLICAALGAWVIISIGEGYIMRRLSTWNAVYILGTCIEQECKEYSDYYREQYGDIVDYNKERGRI